MFNVTRFYPAPNSLALQRSYKERDVIEALRSIFHDKCYMCEQGSISNPEVEHFVPHNKTAVLKYGWDNLFFSCRRCNGIKGNNHINLLDCTISQNNVSDEIIHYAGNADVGEIIVKPSSKNPSVKVLNTVSLLDKCFNLENTSLRKISKESLMEKILVELNNFRPLRDVLAQRLSSPEEVTASKRTLAIMCSVNYPFSIFWRWHLINDVILKVRHPDLRKELGF
ncbi:TPA: HNH endonuclease [Serratia liquefaciens]|nr:HNH endonuclease [Serratia liquefaciens]